MNYVIFKKCISDRNAALLKTYSDETFVSLPRQCKEFDCSTNSLSQLFVAMRILEHIKPEDVSTVLEFGGGYGNLAYAFHTFAPHANYIIIDLPEILAIQYLNGEGAIFW